MNNRKFIYGLVAFTIMSCQSVPVNTKVDIQKGSLANNKPFNNEELVFSTLDWSDYSACYNIYQSSPATWDSVVAPRLDNGDCPSGYSDGYHWGTPKGWEDCVKPTNVVCESYPDGGGGDDNNNDDKCKDNPFSTQALTTDQKLELSYFNTLYGLTMIIIHQTKYSKNDDVFLSSQYQFADKC